jgi:S-adenosylmethionine/arginine decarboxylase-like enzyme
MTNNTSVPEIEQLAQAHGWGVTPLSIKSTLTFVTPTGHKVIAVILESRDNSHISVHVTNDTSFVNMGFASFVGDNHQQECEDYLTQRLSSPAIEHVCTHFDALSNSFGDKNSGKH